MTSSDPCGRTRFGFWITLALVALAMGVLVALLGWAGPSGPERRWTIDWLPGTGPMSIGLGETGLYAALATVGACLLALAATRAEIPPAAGVLTLLALLGGAVAFMAEHFLLRYVALEVVALCVALAPLAEWTDASEGTDVEKEVDRGRWTRLVYLVLRIGDAGLMAGILILWSATGTLEISPALEAGAALPPETLTWIVGGLLLAVWVKLGGWPMHVWQQAGALLSLFSRTWLYRTLTPNLGLYLLYRVTPLLAGTLLATVALWVGALGAAWAAILALVGWWSGRERAPADRLDATMVFLGAAQGGLALVLAALGLKTTVWLALLALTPLRLLLSLAGDAAHKAPAPRGRRVASALYGLGGGMLLAFDALIVWWARGDGTPAGISLGPRLLVEFAVGLIAAWVVVTTVELWRGTEAERVRVPPAVRRWAVLALLACGLVAAILWRAPLLDHLAYVSNGPAFALPQAADLLWFLATSPAGWAALVLGLWAQRLAKRGTRFTRLTRSGQGSDPALALERGIRRGARGLRALVEAGALGGALTGLAQGVLGAAHLAHRWIEGVVLEGATRRIAQTTTDGGRLAYRVMEQGGLEGLLRRTVRAILSGSRWLQRRHTGRLRRNLVWVAASLALAVLALILYAW